MKILNLSAMTLVLLLAGLAYPLHTGGETIPLKGRALFSFTPQHFMVQTDNYVYKISKSQLNAEQNVALDDSSSQNTLISINVPRNSIEYLWPTQPYKSQEDSADNYRKTAKHLVADAKYHKGLIVLHGYTSFSFSEPYVLVHVNNAVYQLKKSALSAAQLEQLRQTGIGGQVDLAIPQRAVNLAWSYKTSPNRGTASLGVVDEVKIGSMNVMVKGTVLYSFDEPLVLVQSDDTIFQIQRNQITSSTPKAFDNPGSKVQLKTPIESVVFVWSTNPKEVEFNRTPTSLR